MYVLGTAGHVDHGKSALVRALTGIDPDRLPEEKRREMTIDLGFAWFTLPGKGEVGIVDVPGHEKFVSTMVSGAVGIDVALLIIAADQGVMPQTREHLAILDLLNVKKGIVVLTKKDLVDGEVLELVNMEAEDVIRESSLSGSPMVAVSALTGEGLSELVAAIEQLLDTTVTKPDLERPRLPIDRVFTIKGFGTVVTGTLSDGRLKVGQEVAVLPPGLRSHIRRLETHKQKCDEALPGSRVAVNLSSIPPEKLDRGMVITTPGWLEPTQFCDVELRAIKSLPREIRYNMSVAFHSGTSEVEARIRLLDKERLGSGQKGWAQLKLVKPVVIAKGDRFVIRVPQGTLGGGEIIDIHPKRHRRFQPEVMQNLSVRKAGSPEDIFLVTLEADGPSNLENLALKSHLNGNESRKLLVNLTAQKRVVVAGQVGPHQILFSRQQWQQLENEVTELLSNYHARFPLRRGMPRQELKSRLKIKPVYFDELVRKHGEAGTVVEERAVIRLPAHDIVLSSEQQRKVKDYLAALSREPYSPPSDLVIDAELFNVLLQENKVVRVAEGIIFSSLAYEEMVRRITGHIKEHGKISVAEVRDFFNTSRKYAVALMEYLDEQRITRRVGNERLLR